MYSVSTSIKVVVFLLLTLNDIFCLMVYLSLSWTMSSSNTSLPSLKKLTRSLIDCDVTPTSVFLPTCILCDIKMRRFIKDLLELIKSSYFLRTVTFRILLWLTGITRTVLLVMKLYHKWQWLVFGFDCNQVDVIRSPLLQITVPKVSRIYVVFNSLLILLDAEDFHFIQTIKKELFWIQAVHQRTRFCA